MIRVGLVGFGMAGRVFHAPLLSSVEGLELAAVVERTSNKAAERYPGITVYRSLEAMLSDSSLQLFVVATPNGTHYAVAKEILSAGKSVVVDKPMTLSTDEAADLIAEARRRTVVPRDGVFRLVERNIKFARHVPPEILEKRAFQFRKRAAQKQRVRAGDFVGAHDCFHQKRFRFPGASRAAEQTILFVRPMEFLLFRKCFVCKRLL